MWIVLGYPPSVALRRKVLPWFSVRDLSACPRCCGASGFLGPAVFMVFAMGSPVSGRDCVLPQSAIVTNIFPPSGGFGSWPSCGVPCLRLALCSSACVSPGGYPSFSQCSFALGSSSLDLLVWEASTVSFSYVFLRDVATLWVNSVFL